MKTETFSYIPLLTKEQVVKQVDHFLKNNWSVGIEFTATPRPDLAFWSWWKLPLFDAKSSSDVIAEFEACCKANPDCYVRITSYDRAMQGQSMSFVAYLPK